MITPGKNPVLALALIMVILFISATGTLHAQTAAIPTEANLKVAFVGDQGLMVSSENVLKLIKSEGAAMLIIAGDFDLVDNPAEWQKMLNSTLGPGFPVFGLPGNHDTTKWPGSGGYQDLLKTRLANTSGAECTGDLGVNSACSYKGLFFVLSGVGTLATTGVDSVNYIKSSLAASRHIWKVCAWHKNQSAMQLGTKADEVGWGAYEECRKGGAIIITGHEHTYERTKTLISTQYQTVDPNYNLPNSLRLRPDSLNGSTFVVVTGLGGASIRNQDRCLPSTYPYGCKSEWAYIYTSDQGANYGALFIDFYINGNPERARGYFETIDTPAKVADSFDIINSVRPSPPANVRVLLR